MSEERCDKTDLIKDQCSHCTGADKREANEHRFPNGDFFSSMYPGYCKAGQHPTGVGVYIVYSKYHSGYICEDHRDQI